MIRGDREHWGSLAKLFHWTIVVCILVQAAIGLIMVDLPKSPKVIPYFTFHKSLGLTIFALAVLRIAWKLFDTRPDAPSGMSRWHVTGAKLGHALLYILLFLVPLSGWWYDSVAALASAVFLGPVRSAASGWTRSDHTGPERNRRRTARISVLGARRRRRRTCADRAVSSVRFEGRRTRAHVARVVATPPPAPTVRITRTDVTGAYR